MKRRGNIMLLAKLCCTAAVFLWIGGGRPAFGQESAGRERIVRYSERYDTPEELPDPPQQYEEENGSRYRLVSGRVEEIPIRGRRRVLAGQIVYPGIRRDEAVPETADLEVEDRESRQTFTVSLPLKSKAYDREQWREETICSVTFHSYGADRYRLGEITVPHDAVQPPLDDCRAELLAAAGLSEEEFRVEECRWQGEPYRDGNGELCRDAQVDGWCRVWDCTAVYEGERELPDYTRYCLVTEYERLPEEVTEESALSSPERSSSEHDAAENGDCAEAAGDIRPVWVRWLLRGTTVTVGLFALLAAVLAFRRLRRAASQADENL